MGKVKTVQEYQNSIQRLHENIYSKGAKNEIEITSLKRELKRQLSAWAKKVLVVVYSPGNEQNPWTSEELDYIPIKPMGLKKETGELQIGDYQTVVCVQEADDIIPAKWKYLRTVIERKGGPQSQKATLMFSWTDAVKGNYLKLIKFLVEEHNIKWVESDCINIVDDRSIVCAINEHYISIKLNDKLNKVELVVEDGTVYKYVIKKTKAGKLNVYEIEYGPGKGGPHDLYMSLYGSTKLKSGIKQPNRVRLHNEIDLALNDDRFTNFWIYVECTRAKFMSFKPKFKGSEFNDGFGANVGSRKASIASLAEHMGAPINWAGSRAGAIDDMKNMIRQSLIRDYVYLLELK